MVSGLISLLHKAREIHKTVGIQRLKGMFNKERGDEGRRRNWALI